MNNPNSLLSLNDISFQIGDHKILKNVSFDIKESEVVGLIGPNGSGKTTLFNVLSGFLKPTSGFIKFRGKDITKMSPSLRAKQGIGRIFQNFGIFREMTLEENILVALEALTKDQRKAMGDIKKTVDETLDMACLRSFAKKKAGSLSGGQMRLLEMARTFKCGKDLLLLDEPTAGVSPKMTHQISDLIKDLKESGKTMLVIEHDLPFIRKICDRVIVLDIGEVVLDGDPIEIQKSKELQKIYFGADPTT